MSCQLNQSGYATDEFIIVDCECRPIILIGSLLTTRSHDPGVP